MSVNFLKDDKKTKSNSANKVEDIFSEEAIAWTKPSNFSNSRKQTSTHKTAEPTNKPDKKEKIIPSLPANQPSNQAKPHGGFLKRIAGLFVKPTEPIVAKVNNKIIAPASSSDSSSVPRPQPPANNNRPVANQLGASKNREINSNLDRPLSFSNQNRSIQNQNPHRDDGHKALPTKPNTPTFKAPEPAKPLAASFNFSKQPLNMEKLESKNKFGKNFSFNLKAFLSGLKNKIKLLLSSAHKKERSSRQPLSKSNIPVEPPRQTENKEIEYSNGKASRLENPRILQGNLIKDEVILLGQQHRSLLFILAVILPVVIVGGVFVYFKNAEKKTEIKLSAAQEQYSQLENQSLELYNNSQEAIVFKKKLELVNGLIKNHVYWTNFFNFLETNTLAQVHYQSGFSGSLNGKYNFDAIADNFSTAVAQVQAFLDNSNVIKAVLSEGAAYSGTKDIEPGIKFKLELAVKPGIFHRH